MINEGNGKKEFETQDIQFASFLIVNRITLLKMIPLSRYQTIYVFEKPSQDILDKWLLDDEQFKTRHLLNTYRHLLAESRALLDEVQR